jgi:fructose-1,6-bisphosphatase I
MIPTMSLARFILQQESKHVASTGELSDLLTAVALGCKIIRQLVATSGFRGLQGYTGRTNVQGEKTHVLDEEADQVLVEILGSSGHFGLLVSEEREAVIATSRNREEAKYVLAFDPLDGSSNLGSNIPVGTIFTIFRKRELGRPAHEADFLQSGRSIVAAGYALYGPKTSFVYSTGSGVHGFTYDPEIGEFLLTDPDVRAPERGSVYSINEGNSLSWDRAVGAFIDTLKRNDPAAKTPYSARYVGSLVADFDRNLKKGGIYIYPGDTKAPQGKLRLLYECMPLAFIAEQAGGRATDGHRPILDIVPRSIHERSPLFIGSRHEVDWYERGAQA